jgi:hypothetical protein
MASKSLAVERSSRQLALANEAEAHRALTDAVTALATYQDANGEGPKDGSLKGILITASKRITLRYGYKIAEMPEPMLRHVEDLKHALRHRLAQLTQQRASYKDLKQSLWMLIDQYADEYQRRTAA